MERYRNIKDNINEVYKRDYVHGKRTNHPTLYRDVVEPIISKEMWENCQVQKKEKSKELYENANLYFLTKIKMS